MVRTGDRPSAISIMSSNTSYNRTFLAILVAAITVGFLVVMRHFLITLMLAAIFTVIIYPGYRWTLRLCRGRRHVAAGIYVTVVALLVVIPAIAFLSVLVSQGIQVSAGAGSMIQNQVAAGHWNERLSAIPFLDRLLPYQDQILGKAAELASAVGRFVVSKLTDLTRGTVTVIVQIVLMFYAMYFFLMDGPDLLRVTTEYLPLSPQERTRVSGRFVAVSVATIKGTVVIGLIQGTLGGIGFWVAGIPGSAFWGAIMVVLAAIPGVGTPLVWVPALAYLFLQGKITTAIIFALYFILVVGLVDNVLRPRLVGKGSQMNELLVLLSTLGGLMAFGLAGFIIGPVIAALFVTLWEIQAIHVRGDAGADRG